MADLGYLALFYLSLELQDAVLKGPMLPEGLLEEQQTEELINFVRLALRELDRRESSTEVYPKAARRGLKRVRVTNTLRIFIGKNELKARPMAKTILLLFLCHPEGIVLKDIADYKAEMLAFYRRLMRSSSPEDALQRVQKILDIFGNDLNVNIARVNAAMNVLVKKQDSYLYRIQGRPGGAKSLLLDRTMVIWEK